MCLSARTLRVWTFGLASAVLVTLNMRTLSQPAHSPSLLTLQRTPERYFLVLWKVSLPSGFRVRGKSPAMVSSLPGEAVRDGFCQLKSLPVSEWAVPHENPDMLIPHSHCHRKDHLGESQMTRSRSYHVVQADLKCTK